jgi:hypothetical protein
LIGARVPAAPLVFLCAVGCAAPGDPLAVVRAQEAAWNRGDIEGFMDGYRRSEEITFSSDQGTIRGWQAVLDRYRKRAWFNAGRHPAMNHAFCSPILPLPNSPSRVVPEMGSF